MASLRHKDRNTWGSKQNRREDKSLRKNRDLPAQSSTNDVMTSGNQHREDLNASLPGAHLNFPQASVSPSVQWVEQPLCAACPILGPELPPPCELSVPSQGELWGPWQGGLGGLPRPSLPEQQLEEALAASHDQTGEEIASNCRHKYSPSLLARLQCSLFSDAVTYANVFLPAHLLLADICLNVGPVGPSKSPSVDCTDLVPPCAAETTPASRPARDHKP